MPVVEIRQPPGLWAITSDESRLALADVVGAARGGTAGHELPVMAEMMMDDEVATEVGNPRD